MRAGYKIKFTDPKKRYIGENPSICRAIVQEVKNSMLYLDIDYDLPKSHEICITYPFISPMLPVNMFNLITSTIQEQVDIEDKYTENVENEDKIYVVEKILDRQEKDNDVQYLVKWAGYDNSENTWEPRGNLINCKEALVEYDNKNT